MMKTHPDHVAPLGYFEDYEVGAMTSNSAADRCVCSIMLIVMHYDVGEMIVVMILMRRNTFPQQLIKPPIEFPSLCPR